MRSAVAIVVGVSLLAPAVWAADRIRLGSQKAKDSYSLGYEFGRNIRRQKVEVDPQLLLDAVRAGLQGKTPALSPQAMRHTLLELRERVAVQQDKRARAYAAEELAKSRAFLAANKANPGVQVLPSGLQYKVLKEGSGPMPKLADTVTVQYRGTLPDGTEFASSSARGQPATIRVIGSIRGWQEALQKMRPGTKWMLYVPPELGYGRHAFGKVPPNSVLIYELTLLAVTPTAPSAAVPSPPLTGDKSP